MSHFNHWRVSWQNAILSIWDICDWSCTKIKKILKYAILCFDHSCKFSFDVLSVSYYLVLSNNGGLTLHCSKVTIVTFLWGNTVSAKWKENVYKSLVNLSMENRERLKVLYSTLKFSMPGGVSFYPSPSYFFLSQYIPCVTWYLLDHLFNGSASQYQTLIGRWCSTQAWQEFTIFYIIGTNAEFVCKKQ